MAFTDDELKAKLRIYLDLLRDACAAFDGGKRHHALNISNTIRLLMTDRGRTSHSLLTQLGATDIELLSTNRPAESIFAGNEGELAGHSGDLSIIEATIYGDGTPSVAIANPKLDKHPEDNHFLAREDWWNQRIYWEWPTTLTRSQIVLHTADKEGSHADRGPVPAALQVMKVGFFPFVIQRPDGSQETIQAKDLHYADLRQIAYELLNSPALLALET